jgi:heme exporter protein D
MYFESFTDFIVMDGHGIYVWTVVAISTVFILTLVLSPIRAKKQFFKQEYQRQLRTQTANSEVNS